mmetsp:Transcript_10098/g.23985  ORF Transcript_10098/g.23985 Transcript_10098/m.23985 type:complete len:96 (-) Transcript_10098:150-437(-)|eukprot:1109671-Rhodomonas_salina.1
MDALLVEIWRKDQKQVSDRDRREVFSRSLSDSAVEIQEEKEITRTSTSAGRKFRSVVKKIKAAGRFVRAEISHPDYANALALSCGGVMGHSKVVG